MEETANQRNESTSEGKTGQYREVLDLMRDATGGLLRTQQLTGKPAGIFNIIGSRGGGHETAIASVFTCVVIGF
ncbi:hypothetical protein F2Q68_00006358 [Brassica cretica]|uniref:Uncharacterized protein n=1 Tax=Brassica cretica TaxID=69181 RepID=A0A8S9J883_BRACR|nr:hypothetical protein F2Q68_00006358 [Brassica cretica]